MKYLPSFLTRFFPTQEPPTIRLAILSPASSVTLEKYINAFIHHLQFILNRNLVVTQYTSVMDERRFAPLLRDARSTGFDLIFAITYLPGIHARRLYTEHGIFIPTLILTYEDILTQPLPNHISGLLIRNNASFIHNLLLHAFPKMKRLILCGNSRLLQQLLEMTDLQNSLAAAGITIVPAHLDQPMPRLIEDLATKLPDADVLFMTKDTLAYHHMSKILALATQHQCPTVAGELHALRMGATIAFGYPEEAIAHETAAQLFRLLQRPRQQRSIIQTPQEVHCHADFNHDFSWLPQLAVNESNVNLKVVRTTKNAQNAKAQRRPQTRSTKQ